MFDLSRLLGPDGFPRAPSAEEWERLTPELRAEVLATLPNEVTDAEMSPPEGDQHFRAKTTALETLRRFYENQKRSVYVAAELPVYYPARRRFAPDLLVVFDVPAHERGKWVVSAEGKGLDFVMEVHFAGDRKKDAERNVELYANLRIPEYFIYDRAAQRLFGYRIGTSTARAYQPILAQHGVYRSEVLGLDLSVEDDRLRFSFAGAFLPEPREVIDRLQRMTDMLQQKADAAAERAAEMEKRAEEDRRRAEEARERAEEERERARLAEQRIRELEAELAKRGNS